jgi:hypothetical protein
MKTPRVRGASSTPDFWGVEIDTSSHPRLGLYSETAFIMSHSPSSLSPSFVSVSSFDLGRA